jgi:hypothetical protein
VIEGLPVYESWLRSMEKMKRCTFEKSAPEHNEKCQGIEIRLNLGGDLARFCCRRLQAVNHHINAHKFEYKIFRRDAGSKI